MTSLFRASSSIALTAMIGLFFSPAPAEARTFWDVFFGHEENQESGAPPEKTLQAPFGKTVMPRNIDPQKKELLDMYGKAPQETPLEDTKNMEQPNVNATTAARIASETATEALTIDPATFDKSREVLKRKFIPYAFQQYTSYVESTNLLSTLKQSDMTLRAMSTSTGVIGREGALAGAYHWVVTVPVLVTYYSRDTKTIDKSTPTQSQSLSVELQLGRTVPESQGDNGIRVEQWRVTAAGK